MSTVDPISPDLKDTLRRLKLGPILDTLPERLTLARQQKMPHQDFLLLVLADEVARRDSLAVSSRAGRAPLDPTMRLEHWDASARVKYDHLLYNELTSLRFVEAHAHVTVVGPVGVGKTFLAHALGHIACRHRCSVLAESADSLLKALRDARLDRTHETELRKRLAVDLLIVDDCGIDAMSHDESRDIYALPLDGRTARFAPTSPKSTSPKSPLPPRPALSVVITQVCRAAKVERETILRPRGDRGGWARGAAMALAWEVCGLGQREIGRQFRVGPHAVSKAIARTAARRREGGMVGWALDRLTSTFKG